MDLSTDTFRQQGHEAIEWVARYFDEIERYPVLAQVAPGEIAASLPVSPPAQGEPLDEILADLDRLIMPGMTHWNHPAFFAYFSSSSAVPGIIAELITAALNSNGMIWKTGPSLVEVEARVLDWFRQMVGLGGDWFGMITDTASTSTLTALAAAREATGFEVRARGLAGRDLPALRLYCSEQAHSSVDKAAIALGLGFQNVVHIAVDEAFRMRPDALEAAIAADRAAGHHPMAVVATVGTTSSTSIDPVPALADLCEREGLWLHVDAAYAGSAAIIPERHELLAGVERADSFVTNPHKWLFTPIDCSLFYTRHPELLKRAFSLVPEYLVTAEQDEATNLMDYGTQLGRRFRALKLWMTIRAFGVEGLAERLRAHCAWATEFAAWVDADPAWERTAPTPLSTVCFRYAPPDRDEATREALNAAIMARVNAGGEMYISHTRLNDTYTLRLAIGNIRTERRHIERAWTLLREAAAWADHSGGGDHAPA